jgi:hypothetical protein
MRCVLLGPSDISKIARFGKIKDTQSYIKEMGKLLARYIEELIITPDYGIYLEIAKAYKKAGGKKLIGMFPEDERFGTKQLKENFKFCDETRSIKGDWYKLGAEITIQGEIVICTGYSPGVMIELSYLKYMQKYLKKGDKILIDSRTISNRLFPEIEEEIKNIKYFSSNEELEDILKSLKKKKE